MDELERETGEKDRKSSTPPRIKGLRTRLQKARKSKEKLYKANRDSRILRMRLRFVESDAAKLRSRLRLVESDATRLRDRLRLVETEMAQVMDRLVTALEKLEKKPAAKKKEAAPANGKSGRMSAQPKD